MFWLDMFNIHRVWIRSSGLRSLRLILHIIKTKNDKNSLNVVKKNISSLFAVKYRHCLQQSMMYYCESTFIHWHQFSWFLQNTLIHEFLISWFLQNTLIHGFLISWFLQNTLIHGFLISWFQTLQATINGKLYFIGFLFSWFKWTTKSTKIRAPRLIMISQY